jgi:hypothetical protein
MDLEEMRRSVSAGKMVPLKAGYFLATFSRNYDEL